MTSILFTPLAFWRPNPPDSGALSKPLSMSIVKVCPSCSVLPPANGRMPLAVLLLWAKIPHDLVPLEVQLIPGPPPPPLLLELPTNMPALPLLAVGVLAHAANPEPPFKPL